jgi:hypothetical protein
MRRRLTRPILLPSVFVLALMVTACGGGDEGAGEDGGEDAAAVTTVETSAAPATTVEATTTTTAAAAAETTAAPTTTAPATTTTAAPTTTTEPDPDPATCLVGDWIVSEEEMNVFYEAVRGNSPGLDQLSVTGFTTLSFTAEGRYEYGPAFTLTLATAGITGTGEASGVVGGTYEVADGIITTTLDTPGLQVIVNIGGQTLDGSDIAGGFLTAVPINNAPYRCTGDTLEIDFQVDGTGAVRVPIVLVPA